MKIKLKDVADQFGGTIIGDNELEFSNFARIHEAQPGDLTFLYLPAYSKHLKTTKATIVLVKPDEDTSRKDLTYLVVDKPGEVFQKIIMHYFAPDYKIGGIANSAFVHPDAKLEDDVSLGENVVISAGCKISNGTKIFHNTVIMENVSIGNNTILYPNVSVREDTVIGSNVIIHSNTVIGSDGFGYQTDEHNVYHKVPQIGNVIIEDDVEIGSNVSIDRSAIGSTILRKGVKIDNLVQIAHNVELGENTVLSSQVGIAGSTKVGKNCIFAGQVGIVGHLDICDNVIVYAQSGVSKSITNSGVYFGSPSKELRKTLQLEAHFRNLPDMAKKIKDLETEISKLRDKIL